MKAYTDIEQSRKLKEILPLDSADMYWDYDVQKHEYYPMVMDDQFNDPFDEVMGFLEELSINWGMSVKALDENDKTIGFLTLSDYRIEEETEKIKEDNPCLLKALNKLNYISFFSFIVAPEYRGTKLNYDMIMSLEDDLKKYDFVFVPVQHQLKTHDYWKRWGGIQFYEDDESKFYAIPKNDKVKIAIDLLG